MRGVLLYQTSDPRFIDRAIAELEAAGIDCYKTGTGWVDMRYARHLWADPVSLFLRRPEDYARANAIIIKLGAVVEKPMSSHARLFALLVFGIAAAAAIAIASSWSPS